MNPPGVARRIPHPSLVCPRLHSQGGGNFITGVAFGRFWKSMDSLRRWTEFPVVRRTFMRATVFRYFARPLFAT